MKNKKAELTSKQIVTVIILIISFGIILLLYTSFNWNPEIDKETCHTSIVLRSSVNAGFVQSSKIVPLKCETEKICFSKGGDCEDIEEDVKIKLKGNKEEAKQEMLEKIADAMYGCHSMLGEGKLDFMPNTLWEENYCLICSRFVLDEKSKQEIEDIGYGELYKYLEEKKTSDGTSYLEYLNPGLGKAEKSKDIFKELQSKSNDEDFKNLAFEDWKIDLGFEEGYIIVGQMAPKGTIGSILAGIGTGATIITAAVLSSTGIGIPAAIALVGVAGASGSLVAVYTHPDGKSEYTPPLILPYDVDKLQELRCSSFETAP